MYIGACAPSLLCLRIHLRLLRLHLQAPPSPSTTATTRGGGSGRSVRIVPLGVLRLPVPQVAAHRLEVLLRLEPELLLSE